MFLPNNGMIFLYRYVEPVATLVVLYYFSLNKETPHEGY